MKTILLAAGLLAIAMLAGCATPDESANDGRGSTECVPGDEATSGTGSGAGATNSPGGTSTEGGTGTTAGSMDDCERDLVGTGGSGSGANATTDAGASGGAYSG